MLDPNLITAAATVGLLLVTIATLYSAHQTSELTRQSKQMETVRHCNERYDRIWEFKISHSGQGDRDEYYRKFWSHQLDQYVQWQHGFIPEKIYRYWLECRGREWHDPTNEFAGLSYQDGFTQTMSFMSEPDFEAFMLLAMKEGPDSVLNKSVMHRLFS